MIHLHHDAAACERRSDQNDWVNSAKYKWVNSGERRSASWRKSVGKRFQEALDAHESRMRKLVEDRGAWPAVFRFSTDHFQWLALYQCGNLSLDSILHRAPHAGDKTTISKGIHSAASLAAIAVRPKGRKLKKP